MARGRRGGGVPKIDSLVFLDPIPFTDRTHNAHSLTVQSGHNVHYYVPGL